MFDVISASTDLLSSAGFTTVSAMARGRPALVFESSNVLGFLMVYETSAELLSDWDGDAAAIIREYQLPLRRSGKKAWNTYVVLLSAGNVGQAEKVAFTAIDEDLRGTRKLTKGDVSNMASVREALLPLLPLQTPPILREVDITAEIRLHATELAASQLDAFFSNADELLVLRALEEVL